MNTALAHLSNIRGAVASLVIAFLVVSALTNTILAFLGGIQFQSPLLYTLLAVTTSTFVVGFVTAGIAASTSERTPEQVRETATAYFVFANAAGTLTALIGHLSQTWETGWRNHHIGSNDGATLVLGLLNLAPETFFTSYLLITAVFATLAFPLIMWGAHLIVGKHIATKTELNSVGAVSLLLLIFSLLIGTEWGAVDADTRQAMTAYGIGLRVAMLLLIFLCFGVYALLLVFSLSRFAALFSFSALRFGADVARRDIWPIIVRVIVEFWYGLLWAGAGVAVLVISWYYGAPYLQTLDFLSEEFRLRFIEAFTYGVMSAAFVAFWAYGGSAAIIAISAFGPSALKSLWAVGSMLIAGVINLLKFAFAVVWFILSAVFEVVRGAVPFLQRAYSSASGFWRSVGSKAADEVQGVAQPAPVQKPLPASDCVPIWPRVVPRLSWPKLEFGSARALFVGLFLTGAVLTACYLAYRVASAIFTVGPATQLVEVEDEPLPPGFEMAFPRPISVCQAVPGTLQWYVEREDTLEFNLNDCLLPLEVRESTDGALVVVGVASMGGIEAQEVDRAIRRGRAIAQWASFQIPETVPVYVLNLGMAREEDAFASGWELFGRVTGERPVLALHITPFPEGTKVPLSTIIDELGTSLSTSNALEHFTHCELFTYDRAAAFGAELKTVADFDCRVPL